MGYYDMKHGNTPKKQMTMAEARQTFNYDPSTGKLSWREMKCGRTPISGHSDSGKGLKYRRVKVARVSYMAHVISWNYMNGIVPDGYVIDHRDRDPSNNSAKNLRMVTQSVNNQNRDHGGHVGFAGKTHSDETKKKMSLSLSGRTLSTEHRKNMSESRLGTVQEQATCPHCKKSGGRSNMKRYHFDNCKQRKA